MISAFLEDTSGFRKGIIISLLLSILLVFTSFQLIDMFAKTQAENKKLQNMYNAQETWLNEFDSKAAAELQKKILKPITEKEIESVQAEQVALLKKSGVKVITVRQDRIQKVNSMKNLKYIKFNATLESSWENIAKALNVFETSHLVVVTGLNMEPVGDTIKTNLEYNIYFQ